MTIQITELDRDILRFVMYGNHKISISKYLDMDINLPISTLKAAGLVLEPNYNELKLTETGHIVAAWEKEE